MSDDVVDVKTVPLSEPALVYKKDTWGNYGQHDNIYVFFLDEISKKWVPVWKALPTEWEINDSRKNLHRKAYVTELPIGLLKKVTDYASSSNRKVKIMYLMMREDGTIVELPHTTKRYPTLGYVDAVELPEGEVRYFDKYGEVEPPI